MTVPPTLIPETPEARAAIARRIQAETGLDDAVLERLVRAFYERARQDPEIGAKFDTVQDWESHIAQITAFWSSVALLSGRYEGWPMQKHFPLDLHGPHFARWLAIFEQTAREICTPAGTDYLMERARRIAASMEIGMAVGRGELPPKRS
jgi:hemoglobin